MQALLPVLSLLLLQLASAAPQTTSTSISYPLPAAPLPGIVEGATGITINSISIGALPDWSHENPRDVNAALGAPVSVIGDYLNVSPRDYSLSQVDYHLPSVLRLSRGTTKPVYAPALLYGDSLDTWTPDITRAIANKMTQINNQGITVWLRLLFEMNGDWMPYGRDPVGFQRVWKEVTDAIRAQSNETYMLWAPNIIDADVDDQLQGYTIFWPGEEYVDLAGLSFYSLGYLKSLNQPPPANQFQRGFEPFHKLFDPSSSRDNLLGLTRSPPLCITETSAPYYYELPSSSPYYDQEGDTDIAGPLPNLTESGFKPSQMSPPAERGDDELYMKASWFVQLTSNSTATRFPRLKSVSLFNYLKRGGRPESEGGKEVLADFRATGGNASVEAWFRGYMGNQTAYEEGYTGAACARRVEWTTALVLLGTVASLAW